MPAAVGDRPAPSIGRSSPTASSGKFAAPLPSALCRLDLTDNRLPRCSITVTCQKLMLDGTAFGGPGLMHGRQ